jgi:pimeloyl-ACP methyl ester carboxylesterase
MDTEIARLEVAGRSIAYRLRAGGPPTLLFLPGYASDMVGAKAVALDAFAESRGLAMLRIDYSGTGSSGGLFEDGTLARWLEETLAAVDRLTEGPLVVIGSSMGGWLALHLALLRPERVAALVGIAAAPDFTNWGFPDRLKDRLSSGETLRRDTPGGEQVTTSAFWSSGQQLLVLDRALAIGCPVRLVHGEADADVPLDIALRTMRALRSADVQLMVIKDGGHRLSEPPQIDAIRRVVAGLLETL